jgi:hypothetical protein
MANQPKNAPKGDNPKPVREGDGQKTSNERGSHTNHKKSPGKRTHQGG